MTDLEVPGLGSVRRKRKSKKSIFLLFLLENKLQKGTSHDVITIRVEKGAVE